MNKKVLVIAVALMAVAMLATPVMAAPPERIQIIHFGPSGMYSAPESWVSGNVRHGRGATTNSPTIISWDTEWPPTDPDKYLQGPSTWVADYNVNLKNGNGVLHYSVVINLDGGTFEGDIVLHGEFTVSYLPATGGYYAVLRNGFRHGILEGTGAYEGWRLEISGDTVNYVYTLEIYLIVPQ
jgi:hypothetical protein